MPKEFKDASIKKSVSLPTSMWNEIMRRCPTITDGNISSFVRLCTEKELQGESHLFLHSDGSTHLFQEPIIGVEEPAAPYGKEKNINTLINHLAEAIRVAHTLTPTPPKSKPIDPL